MKCANSLTHCVTHTEALLIEDHQAYQQSLLEQKNRTLCTEREGNRIVVLDMVGLPHKRSRLGQGRYPSPCHLESSDQAYILVHVYHQSTTPRSRYSRCNWSLVLLRFWAHALFGHVLNTFVVSSLFGLTFFCSHLIFDKLYRFL